MTARLPKDLEQLLAEEPFVRGLARALVADDADEVVQQIWLQALGSRSAVREPRSWLARTVHNAARNLRRSRRRQLQRERTAAVSERLPSSAELLLREERRRSLVLAVDALPAPLRTVVLLRWFEALPPRRIAAELGLPVATVWNQLRRALQLLRERLDAEHGGDRRAWLLPLVPIAAVPGTAFLSGGLLMTAKTKAVAAVALVLVLALGFALRPPHGAALDATGGAGVEPAVASASHPALPPVEAPASEREVVPAAAPATTCSLVVHVRYVASDAPVAQRPVMVCRVGVVQRIGGRPFTTDAAGDVRVEGIATGQFYAFDLLSGIRNSQVEATAGTTTEMTLRLKPGVEIDGIVVDEHGLPVAGALVEYAVAWMSGDARTVAVTDMRGEFRLRDCFEETDCLVGARAVGRVAAPMRLLQSRHAKTTHVRIELTEPGGQVEGVVVRADGRPVAGAWVCVGNGRFHDVYCDGPLPAIVRSDADGRFTALGQSAGSQPVRVRAAGAAPWEGSCEAIASATTSLRIVLQDGITCTGVARGRDRMPLAGVRIEVGDSDAFEYSCVDSAADGSFTLAGLRSGATLRSRHKDGGHATTTVRGEPGATVTCDLQLEFGIEVRGRVVDQAGAPLATRIFFQAEGTEPSAAWAAFAESGADGCFRLADAPPGRLLGAQVSEGEFVDTTRVDHLDPAAGDLLLRVKRVPRASAHLTGRVVTPDGLPLAGAEVTLTTGGGFAVTDAQGAFDLKGVRPGRRAVHALHRDYPVLTSGEREVAADSACDFGELRLIAGGTVRVDGTNLAVGDCKILDVAGKPALHVFGFAALREGSMRSEALAPGSYTLRVRRQGREQSIPFAITAGAETRVDVPAR